MSVTHLVAGQATLAELSDDGLAGETVVDLARGPDAVTSRLLQAKRHRVRLPTTRVAPQGRLPTATPPAFRCLSNGGEGCRRYIETIDWVE